MLIWRHEVLSHRPSAHLSQHYLISSCSSYVCILPPYQLRPLTYFGQFLCSPKCTISPPCMHHSPQSQSRCAFLLLGSSRPLDVDLLLPLLSLLSLFYFFPLLCWWYKWRKCLSPEGHWEPTRHKLLSPCKGLLQWQGFCVLYLSQMLWLSLMLHLNSFVRSWPRAFGKCKPEAKRVWTAECSYAR